MRNEVFEKKNIYGILGTIIVHLIIAIVFLLVKLSSDFKNTDTGILIDLSSLQDVVAELQKEAEKAQEESNNPLNDFHDIAVNEASEKDVGFDINKYIDQVKNEMIEKGDLSKDNFIDRAKQPQNTEGEIEFIQNKEAIDSDQEKKTAAQMESDYSGPTRIKYDLKGRNEVKLPLPIYTCPIGGSVIVEITVDQSGKVISALVMAVESNNSDSCLRKAALKAARNSTFTSGIQFPEKQKGTITYIFSSQ